jgi:hypothetical protein
VSGLPLTSERQVSGRGPAEATATVVHRVVAELGLTEQTLLWNVVPTHPHLPGRSETNRRPTRAEIASAKPFLAALAHGRTAIAVGRLAEASLGPPAVRHPSHGGAVSFRAGLRRILDHGHDTRRVSMDEGTIREHAEAHGQAVVEREYGRAMDDLSDGVKATAAQVMGELPQPITSAEVVRVEVDGEGGMAQIRYSGAEGAATVESRWADVEGRPRIVDLSVVEKG